MFRMRFDFDKKQATFLTTISIKFARRKMGSWMHCCYSSCFPSALPFFQLFGIDHPYPRPSLVSIYPISYAHTSSPRISLSVVSNRLFFGLTHSLLPSTFNVHSLNHSYCFRILFSSHTPTISNWVYTATGTYRVPSINTIILILEKFDWYYRYYLPGLNFLYAVFTNGANKGGSREARGAPSLHIPCYVFFLLLLFIFVLCKYIYILLLERYC